MDLTPDILISFYRALTAPVILFIMAVVFLLIIFLYYYFKKTK